MKFIIILSILTSLLFADEMARIESIVKDVGQLRQKYEACQDKLDRIESGPAQCAVNEMELKQRHQELLALQKENETLKHKYASQLLHVKTTLTKTIASNEKKIAQLDSKNSELNEQIKALHTRLEVREKKVKSLSLQGADLQSKTEAYFKLEDENAKLKMQIVKLKAARLTQATPTMKPELRHVQATTKSSSIASKTYRLKHESKIYDAINGKVTDTWEDQRSFTSNNQKEQWIQITGYFVNRLWKPSRNESLWVKAEDAFERAKK